MLSSRSEFDRARSGFAPPRARRPAAADASPHAAAFSETSKRRSTAKDVLQLMDRSLLTLNRSLLDP
jgi:hypothetical protein